MDNLDLFPPSGPRELLSGASSAVLHEGFLSPLEAQAALRALLYLTPWEQRDVFVFGREVPQPRLVAWFGDPEGSYRYSGLTLTAHALTPELAGLQAKVEALTGTSFNSLLANLYRDGEDCVGWHSDNEPEFGIDPIIASLSLGATRRFDFRRQDKKIDRDGDTQKVTTETIQTDLRSGDLVVMSGACQREWKHQVASTKKVSQPRINLTFRTVI